MNYLSVCSGIEAATVAWHSLGWSAVGFSEIEPFPCKVLVHHYPDVPNFGDMTKFKEWPDANIDVLVGGTPCQSFSIAGLRKGLDDPRGNLMLTYLAIADRYKPKWIVWENVPGVLSSNRGRDFGTLLGGLGKLGYGFAYRVLDAQFCRAHEHPRAVPQRRRRVFVVGCIGDWRSAAGILFDSESLRGNPPPSRNKGKEVAPTIRAGAANGGAGHGARSGDSKDELIVTTYALAGNTIGRAPQNGGNHTGYDDTGSNYTLTKTDVHTIAYPINTQIATRHKAMGERTGLGIGANGDPSFTLQAAHSHAVAYIGGIDHENNGHGMDVTGPLMKGSPTGGGRPLPAVAYGVDGASKADKPCSTTYVHQQMRVRRLTPLECERLQGFPDNYTNIPGASNTARYKALGNSMAVNCMRILGERIAMAESIDTISCLL